MEPHAALSRCVAALLANAAETGCEEGREHTAKTPVGFSLPPEGKKNNSRIKFDSDFTADSYTFDEAQPSTLNTPTNGLMRCQCDGLIAPRIVPLSEDGSIAHSEGTTQLSMSFEASVYVHLTMGML